MDERWTRQCAACRFDFHVDDPVPVTPEREYWRCPPCVVASLGEGSFRQRMILNGGSLASRTVFTR